MLRAKGGNDEKAAESWRGSIWPPPTPSTCAALEAVFCCSAPRRQRRFGQDRVFSDQSDAPGPAASLLPALDALMLRVEAARPQRIALAAAERTSALHCFAAAWLPRYRAKKAARGWLDFDDLIARAAALAGRPIGGAMGAVSA